MMPILPESDDHWIAVALAPFKTYAIGAFLIAAGWSGEIRGQPMIFFMILGYGVCLLSLLGAGVLQHIHGGHKAARGTFHWSAAVLLLGLAFALRWLPTLAE